MYRNITIIGGTMTEEEAAQYWDMYAARLRGEGRDLARMTIEIDRNTPEFIGIHYELVPLKFERLRRITGYLVGTLDRWNDAKHAEEADRVKHGC